MERISISEQCTFSRIIRGFWRLVSWEWSTEELISHISACIDHGVTTFDTAEVYSMGECETQLGKALQNIPRNQYQIVTKTGISRMELNGKTFGYYDTRYDRIIASCKESLRKLGCEYIDLYLIHREDPLIDFEQVAAAFQELKKEGLILEAGVSNFDPYKFNTLNAKMNGTLRTDQIEWSPCCWEHFESGLIDMLNGAGIPPMIWSPLAGGKLFNGDEPIYEKTRAKVMEIAERHKTAPETVVYAWIMMHPVNAMPIVGSRRMESIRKAVNALELKLEQHEWFEIYAASGQRIIR